MMKPLLTCVYVIHILVTTCVFSRDTQSLCTQVNSTTYDVHHEVIYNWSDFTLEMFERSDFRINIVASNNNSQLDRLTSVSVSHHFRYFIESMINPCVKRVTVNVIPANICYLVDSFAIAFDKPIYTSSCDMYWISSLNFGDARLTVVNDTLARSAFNLARVLLNHFTFKSLNVEMNILYSSGTNTLTTSSVNQDIELHRSNMTGGIGKFR